MNKFYYPSDNWKKLNYKNLNSFEIIEEVKKNYFNISGILISHNGYIVFEEYFNEKNKNDRFNIASVTKSVLSATFGIGLDKNYISSINDKVIDYFPEYKLKPNRIRDKVTIHELLSMTAPYAHKNMKQKLGKLIHSDNWIKYSLEILGLGNNTGDFNYTDANTHLLSGIISKSTEMTAREFTNKYLASKIGMSEIPDLKMKSFEIDDILFTKEKSWLKDKQGITIGGWGLTLTLRDMAKLGLLYQRKGLWNNKQVLSSRWIEQSITNYSTNYGYLWWLRDTSNYNAYYAMGTGGNVIACIPKLDRTIAIVSDVVRSPIKDRWELIDQYILPAFYP